MQVNLHVTSLIHFFQSVVDNGNFISGVKTYGVVLELLEAQARVPIINARCHENSLARLRTDDGVLGDQCLQK